MSLTKKQNIKISIYITFITMILSMVVHFFYTPFLLNKVGDDQYGLYGFATSALSWLSVAVNAILSAYNKIASEEIAKNPKEGEEKVNSIYSFIVIIWSAIISVIASVLLLLMALGIISLNAYSPADQKTILILFIIVTIQMIITVATKVANLNITYNNHHVWVKMSNLIVTIAAPIISIPFLLNGCNIIVIVIIQVSVNIISHIVDIFYDSLVLKKKYRLFPKKADLKMIGPILAFCSIILINEISYQLDSSIDNIVMGSKGYSIDITLYSLALTIVTIASTCSSMIYTPFIPTVFRNEANNNREANLKLYDMISFIQSLLWLFIAGGFIACGKEFTYIWVGKDREIVYYICSSLFIIRSMSNCAGPTRDMMRANNKHLHRSLLAIGVTTLNATLTILFVNILPAKYAIWGCIIGTGASSIIGWWIIANIMNYKYLNVNVRKFLFNFTIIASITATSDAIILIIKNYIFAKYINHNAIIFLISGSLFVLLFVGSVLLIYKKRVKEYYRLLRSK